MIPKIGKLLEQYKVTKLRELSKELEISSNVIKNISCGRTAYSSLFEKRKQYRISPEHSENLAELIGIVLGDGNIFTYDRCQRLTISCDGSYAVYVKHVKHLVRDVFKKEPSIIKRSKANCHDVCLYMQDIDKALNLKAGNKIKNKVEIPNWILAKKEFLIRCLKGLFETDGNFSKNKKSYVQFIEFENKCPELRLSVYKAMKRLGYNPQLGNRYVRLARQKEVLDFARRINYFRYGS